MLLFFGQRPALRSFYGTKLIVLWVKHVLVSLIGLNTFEKVNNIEFSSCLKCDRFKIPFVEKMIPILFSTLCPKPWCFLYQRSSIGPADLTRQILNGPRGTDF